MCDLLRRVDVTPFSKVGRKYESAAGKDKIRELVATGELSKSQ
jgi:hypothetical protein